MTYDTTQDVLIDALRAIALTEVNPALSEAFGGAAYPAIRETRGMPLPIEIIERTATPLLMVFVERETSLRTSHKNLDFKCNVVFEYLGPLTPLTKLDARWPILRQIWRSLFKAVSIGKSVSVEVLKLAGVQETHDDEATVDFRFAESGDSAYPFFSGKIPMTVRPSAIDWDALPDFTEVFADINRVDGNPALQPQVEVVLETNGIDSPWHPSTIPQLTLLLDETSIVTSGTDVVTWKTLGGPNALDFIRAPSALGYPQISTTNGLPSVNFSGSIVERMWTGNLGNMVNPDRYHMFLMVDVDQIESDAPYVWQNPSPIGNHDAYFGVYFRKVAGVQKVGTICWDGEAKTAEVPCQTGRVVIEVWHEPGFLGIQWNGVTQVVPCGEIVGIGLYLQNTLGATQQFAAGLFDGRICQVIASKTFLDDWTRRQALAYLRTKWNAT